MSAHRPFEVHDLRWTVGGLAFGLFYGFCCMAFVALLVERFWIVLLIGLPFLFIQLAAIVGLDALAARSRQRPPNRPIPWVRHHAVRLGAAVGATAGLIMIRLAGPLLEEAS